MQKQPSSSNNSPVNSLTQQSTFYPKQQVNSLFIQRKQSSQLYTGPMIVLDYKIEMSWLGHQCLDSMFPLMRVGATLGYCNNELFMFGGSPDIQQNNLILHKFRLQSSEWKHLKSTGDKPMLSLMYHTCSMFKENAVFVGGVAIHRTDLKKLFNPHIYVFNTIAAVWTQFNWGVYLKNHAACMINNVLVIHGGINERQKCENTLYIVHLNFTSNLNFSKVMSSTTTQHLSHHKLISTLNEDNRLRLKFKLDGLISFGGKHSDEKLSNQIYYIESRQLKLSDEDMTGERKWQCVQVNGIKPQARMCHTFDLLHNKGLAVVIGGINEQNQYLDDLWILDLFGLTWSRVEEVPLLKQTRQLSKIIYRGIAYHCSVVNDSEIYVYGGLTTNKMDKQFYLIQTQKFKRQYSRHQSRKKIQGSSNMISFKAFQ